MATEIIEPWDFETETEMDMEHELMKYRLLHDLPVPEAYQGDD